MPIFARTVSGLKPRAKPPIKGSTPSIKGLKPRTKKRRVILRLLLVLVLIMTLLILVQQFSDRRLFPQAAVVAEMRARSAANILINAAIGGVISGKGFKSEDFFTKNLDTNGRINAISANTLLVNDICADLSTEISEKLDQFGQETVNVPLGALMGIDVLANMGPLYSVKIMPKGTADVDYETCLNAAGINQTQFQIWLDVSINMRIVNPLREKQIQITRKVALVDTVFSGEVPNGVFKYD